MLSFPNSIKSWQTDDFKQVLKQEIESLNPLDLPLQLGVSQTSYALDLPVTAIINGFEQLENQIIARVGIFFSGLIPGCSCNNDPTPVEPQQEYCDMIFKINLTDGASTAEIV